MAQVVLTPHKNACMAGNSMASMAHPSLLVRYSASSQALSSDIATGSFVLRVAPAAGSQDVNMPTSTNVGAGL